MFTRPPFKTMFYASVSGCMLVALIFSASLLPFGCGSPESPKTPQPVTAPAGAQPPAAPAPVTPVPPPDPTAPVLVPPVAPPAPPAVPPENPAPASSEAQEASPESDPPSPPETEDATAADASATTSETPSPDSAAGVNPLEVTKNEMEQVTADRIKMRIDFSASVDLEALKTHLKLTDTQGVEVPYELEAASPSQTFLLSFAKTAPVPLKAVIQKGLLDSQGLFTLAADVESTYPGLSPLAVKKAIWKSETEDVHDIVLQFSAPVAPATLQQYVTLTTPDNAALSFFPMEDQSMTTPTIRLNTPVEGISEIILTINTGLIGQGMQVLQERYTTTLKQSIQPLRMGYHWWDTNGVDGAALVVEFNHRFKPDVLKAHLSIEPPVENLTLESRGRNAFRITADWKSEVFHQLVISKDLRDLTGNLCTNDALNFPLEQTPKIEGVGFGYSGKLYIPRKGLGQMTVASRNVKTAVMSLWQVFPSNLPFALSQLENGFTNGGFNDQFAREIGSQTIRFSIVPDKKVSVPIDLKTMLPPDQKGVFTLQFADSSDWRNTRMILWTDIGLLAHWQNTELSVFAHNLLTLAPLPQAKVSVYSTKNQIMGTANTDEQGLALFKNMDKALGTPKLLLVETEKDYTFLELNARTDDPTDFDPEMPEYTRKSYDAFLYADRNLYRPGETIHARWIVRTNYGDALPGVPLEFRLINPKNQIVQTQPITLSNLGTGGQDIATEKAYLTGKYTLELRVPKASVAIGSTTFQVEEFVPTRMKADVATDQNVWLPDTPYAVRVNAVHLVGTPAADRKCETKIILRRGSFKSEAWKGFQFGNDTSYTPEIISLGEAQTDAAGQASFSYTLKPNPKYSTPMEAVLRGEVFEPGGRSVTGIGNVRVFPSDICLGVSAEGQADGNTLEVYAAAVRPDETPAALSSVKITLEREDWSYYVRRYSDYNEPDFARSYQEIETQEVPLTDGRGSAKFNLSDQYGYFRIRIYSEATPQFSTLSFYKYWKNLEIVDAARPSLIKVAMDKTAYAVGDEVTVRVESPFNGKGIIIVQGEELYKALPVDIVDNVGTVKFVLLREYYPNVWVEATVVHEVKEGQSGVYPFSSFAMANVPINDPQRQLNISYPGLPAEIRPAQNVEIVLNAVDALGQPVSAEVTLAAVDEGIHAIMDYQDPDPMSWFQRPRKPDYRRAHYYDKVAYDFQGTPIGGDMIAKRLGKGNADIGENWIKPVALWSGAVQTDAQGQARINFQVPEFNGQLRLVAVATSNTATGAHSEKMFVRRPYILHTSMPRFALPGDQFKCRAVVLNTTDAPCTAHLQWRVSGALQSGQGSQELTIAAKSEAMATADFAAAAQTGQGAIDWELEVIDANGVSVEKIAENAPIPVFPPAVYQQDHLFASIDPGQSRTFKNVKFFDDAGLENSFLVSANPIVRLKDALKWVIGYPYGCIEQTTSRCLPMYALRKSALFAQLTGMETKALDQFLYTGINRLFTMQGPSGGLSMWPWYGAEYEYGSVYAAHFLTLAHRERELQVPEDSFRRLQNYLRKIVNDGASDSPSARHLRAYAVYVLALDGDLDAINQIARFDSIPLPKASRYLLASALAINTKDPARVKAYLETTPVEDFSVRERFGTLNSDIRNLALEVLATMTIDPAQADMAEKINTLVRYLENGPKYTTQDVAFVVTALGMYFSQLQIDVQTAGAKITAPGQEKTIQGAEVFECKQNGPAEFIVNNTGSSPMFVDFATAGIPQQPEQKVVEEGLKVQRTILSAGKIGHTLDEFKHGETYVVQLTLNTVTDLENVVVADLMPAGFEIENTRLDPTLATFLQLPEALTPSYLEIRDDRLVVAFDKLSSGETHFYYLFRAVTPGVFQQPAVRAECMYDPEVRASNLPGSVTISE